MGLDGEDLGRYKVGRSCMREALPRWAVGKLDSRSMIEAVIQRLKACLVDEGSGLFVLGI